MKKTSPYTYLDLKANLYKSTIPGFQDVIKNYEKFVSNTVNIENEIWYSEYISLFEPVDIEAPSDLKDIFDLNLFQQLAAGSLSQNYMFEVDNVLRLFKKPQLIFINDNIDEGKIIYNPFHLFTQQMLLGFFDLFIIEHMGYAIFTVNEQQVLDLKNEKEKRLIKWQTNINSLPTLRERLSILN